MKFAIRTFFVGIILLSVLFSYPASSVSAVNSCTLNLSGAGSDLIFQVPTETVTVSAANVTFNDQPVTLTANGEYSILVNSANSQSVAIPVGKMTNGTLSSIDVSSAVLSALQLNVFESRNVVFSLYRNVNNQVDVVCTTSALSQRINTNVSAVCESGSFAFSSPSISNTDQANLIVQSSRTSGFANGLYRVFLERTDQATSYGLVNIDASGGSLNPVASTGKFGPFPPGKYQVVVTGAAGDSTRFCVVPNVLTVIDPTANPAETAAFALCDQATNEADKAECRKCVSGSESGPNTISDPGAEGYWTAFGCVKTSKEGIVTSFIRIGIGVSGGFVLLSILYGAFLVTTSSGDIKRVQEGQEMITSAIMGLLFVLFSIIILRFIGVTILQIPGFGA